MTGEPWNTLVAPPTERELAAAMAEVRVRAVVHERRAHLRRRVFMIAGAVLIGAAGFAGGRSTAAGMRFYEHWEAWMGPLHERSVNWMEPGGRASSAALPDGLRRWHITRSTLLDGQQVKWWQGWQFAGTPIDQGDSWVEGPAGTTFGLRVMIEGSSWRANIRPVFTHDSIEYRIQGMLVHDLGRTARGGSVTEELGTGQAIRLPIGTELVLYPFGKEPQSDGSVTRVVIDGPRATSPTVPVAWRPMRLDSLIAKTRLDGHDDAEDAITHGVRWANTNIGSVNVQGRWWQP